MSFHKNRLHLTIALLLSACTPTPTLVSDVNALEDNYHELQDQYDRLTSQYDELRAQMDTIECPVPDHAALLTEIAEIRNTASVLVLPSGLPRFIDTDITLDVPVAYADINEALSALDGAVISPAAAVTIQVAPGDYRYTAPVVVQHANGNRIRILGDAANPGAVTLSFPGDAIAVMQGHTLGLLEGVSLVGSGTGFGVLVRDNGVATARAVHTHNFGVGYAVYYGGVLSAENAAAGSTPICFRASGSMLFANESQCQGATAYGVVAETGSVVTADGAPIADAPIASLDASVVSVAGACALNNGAAAYESLRNGYLYADDPACDATLLSTDHDVTDFTHGLSQ